MQILTINSGSSSIKFQLINMPSEELICSGVLERIGTKEALIRYMKKDLHLEEIAEVKSHKIGLEKIVELLRHPEKGAIKNVNEIDVVGHRVVHGGDSFSDTTLVTEKVIDEIRKYASLAPLHNPNNLEGILVSRKLFSKAKQVVVFDTAFHQTMPLKARKYAIEHTLYEKHGIQAYGFHGTSHKYVSEKAIAYLPSSATKIISIHLGNGCSMTAVKNGESIDHSLGFAPSNGLIMGTRSGDIDHAIVFHLIHKLGYSTDEVNHLLNKESGMLGLTGFSDLRDIQAAAEKGASDCQLALEMNAYRIKKYIGAYSAAMNGLDAIIFTAGIGENSSMLRELVCTEMEYFGIVLDTQRNERRSHDLREINTDTSKVKILVVPTNEELEIAKQAFSLLQSSSSHGN